MRSQRVGHCVGNSDARVCLRTIVLGIWLQILGVPRVWISDPKRQKHDKISLRKPTTVQGKPRELGLRKVMKIML